VKKALKVYKFKVDIEMVKKFIAITAGDIDFKDIVSQDGERVKDRYDSYAKTEEKKEDLTQKEGSEFKLHVGFEKQCGLRGLHLSGG
jgi:hypothetical protein